LRPGRESFACFSFEEIEQASRRMFAATAHADDAAFTIIDPHGGGPGFAGLDRMIFPAKRDCRAKSECDGSGDFRKTPRNPGRFRAGKIQRMIERPL